ncbi:NCS2 family permease [Streptomyces iranensis]|uniref:AGZA family xanthine/uracil permease-like MFS transporter n=1 Tax=Streptomyces iranensis TaxID=576784 RepID=A0A061AAS9_9ACTN|nr:NCS2 family permease [Streptomyces iranensis]MBP2067485.1 AGZA family xanthine/uracil permease-like MFS transporter [Streptomyces iranensis]CDR17526.1 Xanthine/uracil/vitamin C permease [Streptomyces iranensis]
MTSSTRQAEPPRSGERPRSRLDAFFQLTRHGTSIRTEFVAGMTMFFATGYLVAVVPALLARGGMPRAEVTTAVILVVGLATALGMGLYARRPFVVGPGIGGVALLGVTISAVEGVPWQTAMGMAFLSGALFLILTLAGLRRLIADAVPTPLKAAIAAGVGLFIAYLGFQNAHFVVANPKSNALSVGDLGSSGALLALIGLLLALLLTARRVPGALLIAVVATTLIGIPMGVTKVPDPLYSLPSGIGDLVLRVDVAGALKPEYLPYVLTFLVSEFFSTMGTVLAVSGRAGLLDANGNLPDINKPFVVDSASATAGTLVGVPAMTAYVESAAGAEAGGRTGLSAVFAGAGFLASLVLAPFVLMIPAEATAGVLIVIGLQIFGGITRADLGDLTTSFPALLTVVAMVFTFNIGTGIAAGILAYAALKLLTGRVRELPWPLGALCLPLVYYFWNLAH